MISIDPKDLVAESYDYFLPVCDIAQTPVEPRDSSRLLVVDRRYPPGSPPGLRHRRFTDLLEELQPEDCLILNQTRVRHARLLGFRWPGGGAAEVFLLQNVAPGLWDALLHPGRRMKPGTRVWVPEVAEWKLRKEWPAADRLAGSDGGVVLEVREVRPDGQFRVAQCGGTAENLEAVGQVPLPPYITEELADGARYQTVYAETSGSVAAPTAGLHFTRELLDALEARGVRRAHLLLHVGVGTFQPVREGDLRAHLMHREEYEVTSEVVEVVARTRRAGGRVIAVGTTVVRALESAAQQGELQPGRGTTDLFIYPGYKFRVVDDLITNFHWPRSTLLMLVSALMGRNRMMAAYREARRHAYRFYSFGDAMLLQSRGGR